jgi:hypothetical protein
MREESFEKFKRVTSIEETGKEGYVKSSEVKLLVNKLIDFGKIRVSDKVFLKHFALKPRGLGIESFAKISVTNSGCLENPVINGGRSGYYKQLINEYFENKTLIKVYDLNLGSVIENRTVKDYLINRDNAPFDSGEEYGSMYAFNIGPNFGQLLFDIAVMDLFEDKIPRDVNLSIIAEAGKARTVGSGSCMLSLAEYPLSHILSELLKLYPSTKAGMSKSNNAWNFFREYTPLREEYRVIYDLETATDYGPWSVGRDILESVFDKLSLPKAYCRAICNLAFSKRNINYKGKYKFSTSRGWPMGEPLTKPLMTLCQLLVELSVDGALQSAYVGDDAVIIYHNRRLANEHLRQVPRFGLLLSDLDTWIVKNGPIFYTENVIDWVDPTEEQLSYSDIKEYKYKLKSILDKGTLPFIDAVPSRIINNVEPERRTHSGSSTGKVELLASKQSYNDDDSIRVTEVVAPWLQRTLLRRSNPIDIVPGLCLGRGLYEGIANLEFFKERVPYSLALGGALAYGVTIDHIKLSKKETKYLFLYRLVREGFFKNHDRSLRTAIPLKMLEEFYDDMVERNLMVYSIPEGEDENNFIEIIGLVKTITSAWNEMQFYTSDEENSQESNPDEVEYLDKYRHLVENVSIDEPYKLLCKAAVTERTRRLSWRDKRLNVAFIKKSDIKGLRLNWLNFNVNLWTQVNPPNIPDRNDEEQSKYREITNSIYWTFIAARSGKLKRTLEEEVEGLKPSKVDKKSTFTDDVKINNNNLLSNEPILIRRRVTTERSPRIDFGKPKSPRNRFQNDSYLVPNNEDFEAVNHFKDDLNSNEIKRLPRFESDAKGLTYIEVHGDVQLMDASHIVRKLLTCSGKYTATSLGFVRSDVWGTPKYPIQVYLGLDYIRSPKQAELLLVFMNSVSIAKIRNNKINFVVNADSMSMTHVVNASVSTRICNGIAELLGYAVNQ